MLYERRYIFLQSTGSWTQTNVTH